MAPMGLGEGGQGTGRWGPLSADGDTGSWQIAKIRWHGCACGLRYAEGSCESCPAMAHATFVDDFEFPSSIRRLELL